jgi:hypothetical protein
MVSAYLALDFKIIMRRFRFKFFSVQSIMKRKEIRFACVSLVQLKNSVQFFSFSGFFSLPIFFCLLPHFLKLHLHHFSKIKTHEEVTKLSELRFFILLLVDNRRIRSRIRIRIS